MNQRLLDAYYEYTLERVQAGILDHSLDIALLDGKTIEEHMIEVLRAAGRLPRVDAPTMRKLVQSGRSTFIRHQRRRRASHPTPRLTPRDTNHWAVAIIPR